MPLLTHICNIYHVEGASFLGLLALGAHGGLALLGLLRIKLSPSRGLLGFSGFLFGLDMSGLASI
jgi:hypothetical protein